MPWHPRPTRTKTSRRPQQNKNLCHQREIILQKNHLNTDFFILADLGRHSGLNRFFVWDFDTEQIIQQCLVSHGCGSNQWGSDASREKPQFSNTNNSHCSSLGKYRIGERGFSQWGIHLKYLLHGLEASNSNAFSRVIVLQFLGERFRDRNLPTGHTRRLGLPCYFQRTNEITRCPVKERWSTGIAVGGGVK